MLSKFSSAGEVCNSKGEIRVSFTYKTKTFLHKICELVCDHNECSVTPVKERRSYCTKSSSKKYAMNFGNGKIRQQLRMTMLKNCYTIVCMHCLYIISRKMTYKKFNDIK